MLPNYEVAADVDEAEQVTDTAEERASLPLALERVSPHALNAMAMPGSPWKGCPVEFLILAYPQY